MSRFPSPRFGFLVLHEHREHICVPISVCISLVLGRKDAHETNPEEGRWSRQLSRAIRFYLHIPASHWGATTGYASLRFLKYKLVASVCLAFFKLFLPLAVAEYYLLHGSLLTHQMTFVQTNFEQRTYLLVVLPSRGYRKTLACGRIQGPVDVSPSVSVVILAGSEISNVLLTIPRERYEAEYLASELQPVSRRRGKTCLQCSCLIQSVMAYAPMRCSCSMLSASGLVQILLAPIVRFSMLTY